MIRCPVCWLELPPGWEQNEVVPRHRKKGDTGVGAAYLSGWCAMSGQPVNDR